MPKNSKKVGNKIKKIRDSYNLSQDRFAKRLGLSGKTISAYETGRSVPPLRVVEKIVNAYDTPFINIKEEQKSQLSSKLELLQHELLSIKKMIDESLSL